MFKEFVNNRTLIMILAAFSLSVSSFSAYAQVYDYHPPLKIPMIMSGSFCEPRNGHFHAGIDLKTVGITGQTLHAIDDAVVYRIRISGRGYGRALYLLHPDSSLSVYAHMQRFMPEVEEAARKMQYKNKSFYLDTILQDSLFVYNKGECIGYSGNSGSSGGAHLHFEIRKMPSEHCINPQKFWSFNDNIKPQYRGIVFYDIDANHKTEAERSDYQHSGRVRNRDISLAQGKWGIGAEIIDRMNRTHNRYGILELIMLVNKDTVYHSKIDTFAWSNQKYTPAWFDAYFMETRSRYVQRCFREPGNKAGLFVNLKNDGVIELAEGDVKKIQLKARDGAGNWSGFRFTLKASDKEKPPHVSKKMYPAGKAVKFPFEGGFLSLPENALYRDALIEVHCRRNAENQIKGWNFTDHDYVFLEPVRLSLDASTVKPQNKNNTVVMRKRNGNEECITGEWNGPYFSINTKKPGYFYLATDSIPPRLYGSRMRDSISFSGYNEISYRVSDKLSGLKHYNAWIDGKWVLLEYEKKDKKLFHRFDKHTEKGKWHNWKIRVEDAVGNVREETGVLYY